MNNCLLKNPPIVHIVDVNEKILHSMVFVGAVPKIVEDVLRTLNTSKTNKIPNAHILREYFGNYYKQLLNIPLATEGGSEEPVDNIESFDNELNLNDTIEISDKDLMIEDTEAPEQLTKINVEESTGSSVKFDSNGRTTYIFDIHLYPEDKISEIRDKICLVTGIPMYRQHLYWYSGTRLMVPYKLYADRIYNVNIVEEFKRDNNQYVAGMPVDKFLYVMREEIRVETIEPFTLIGSLHNNSIFYIMDLGQVIAKTKAQLYTLIKDKYLFELFYYGFIIRFWPQMTPEVFRTYLENESDIANKYPDLFRSMSWFRRVVNTEQEIINDNYKLASQINDIISGKSSIRVVPTITSMIATTNEKVTNAVNIRNIFDKFIISKCHPEVHAYVSHNDKKFLLKKKHSKNQSDINFPSAFNTGIIIAISLHKRDQDSFHSKNTASTLENEQSRYLFLNILDSGKYFIKSMWNEEDGHTFESVYAIMKKFIDPIITSINTLGKYVFITGNSLPILTKANITYKSLNICVFWKKLVTEAMFKAIRGHWQQYSIAEIISTRGIQQSSVYEFTFRKGAIDFDTSIIERILSITNTESIRNHYAKMSNSALKQKWTQLYDGRVVKMSHRTTDIKFDVTNIREQEFHIFYEYLLRLIIRANVDKNIKPIAVKKISDNNKLNKLREADPELYNLKKYGSNKVYSIMCQNPRQPVIYTDDEVNSMKKSELQELDSFYNFTLNKPAYYACPTDKYPHLSFIVGVHPKGYCIPCCGKSIAAPKTKKNQINQICSTTFEYDEKDKLQTKKIFKTKVRHVVSYGKEINVGRISKLPVNSIRSLFTESDESKYFIFGVEQHFPNASNVGILYSLSKALNQTPVIIVQKMLAGLSQQKQLFTSLLNGAVAETFENLSVFIEHIGDIFIKQKEVSFLERTKFKRWSELFMELSMYVLDICVIVFNDPDGTGTVTDLLITDALRWEMLSSNKQSNRKYMLVLSRNIRSSTSIPIEDYFPIFIINIELFFRQREITTTLFTNQNEIINDIFSILSTVDPIPNIFNMQVIKDFISKHPVYSIKKKYVNKRNLVYALILQRAAEDKTNSVENIYVACDYSSNISDGIAVVFDIFRLKDYKLKLSVLETFIDEVTKTKVDIGPVSYIALANDENPENIIGLRGGGLVYYANIIDKQLRKLPVEKLGFDPFDVNMTIAKNLAPTGDDRKQLANAGLYKNNIYNLLVIEFTNYIEKERNTTIRNKIIKLIEDTNFRKSFANFATMLAEILDKDSVDFESIMNHITVYYYKHFDKKELIKSMTSQTYEFDRVTLNKMQNMSRGSLITELKKIIKYFSVEKDLDLTNLKFPNVYLPCEWKTSEGYCSGKKLIIHSDTEKSLSDSLVELLADDITNPLISKYMFNGLFADNIINFFNFEQRPMQVISIFNI